MNPRELLVMRHAKSSWDTPLDDHGRPLNARGQEAAQAVAVALQARGWLPELVLCSDATRTRETVAWMEHALGRDLVVRFRPRLYLPAVDDIRHEVALVGDKVGRVMVVSHNPGCEDVTRWLTGEPVGFTTANVGRILFRTASWEVATARPGLGRLDGFLQPRSL